MSQKTGLDPRAERSRAWMRAALLALMREKDYQKITVAEITDRAGLSRPTFYLHYKSKDEVLVDHLITEIAHIFDEFSVNIQKTGGVQPGLLATQKLFKEVRGYADVFQVVQQIGAERIVRQSLYHSFFAYLQDLARRYQVRCALKFTAFRRSSWPPPPWAWSSPGCKMNSRPIPNRWGRMSIR